VILARHARGFVTRFVYPPPSRIVRVPARDVIGISPAEVQTVREHMARWWAARRTREIIGTVRFTRPGPARYGVRELDPNQRHVIQWMQGLRTEGGGNIPVRAVPPRPRLRVRAALPRMAPRAVTVGSLAAQIVRGGWKAAAASGVVAAVLEWLRWASWLDVLALFRRLGLDEPADREEAVQILETKAAEAAA
jgi:hypothetical protein